MTTKYGEHTVRVSRTGATSSAGVEIFLARSGKMCEMVEIADECVESINGNCATDAGFSRALSHLQRECDQEKGT